MSQSERRRRHFSGEQKVAILREHLLDRRPVSDVCEENGINPTLFYRWQKEFFEGGHAAFERGKGDPEARRAAERIAKLESKIQLKDEVLAELMADYVAVKKTLGDG